MREIRFLIAGLVVLSAACGGGDSPTQPGGGGGGGGETLVHAKRVTATTAFTFSPSSEVIPARDTIYFTFQSTIHNVVFTAATGAPADVPSTSNATVKREFPTAGTFSYHCTIHPSMTGQITVNP